MEQRKDTTDLSFRKVSFGRGGGKLSGDGGQGWNGSTKEKTKGMYQDEIQTMGNVTKVQCCSPG